MIKLSKKIGHLPNLLLILSFTILIGAFFTLQTSCDPAVKLKMEYKISMEKPSSHYFHVELNMSGFKKSDVEFVLPVWSPGYYWINNYPKNILNFNPKDENGNSLKWEKISKNIWRVATNDSKYISLEYDVYAYSVSVAESFLDPGRGFISPTGIFMYVNGMLNQPVTVEVIPNSTWSKISTGLDPVEEKQNTYFAPNFDVLYDCPILVGNQEVISFQVKGITHHVALEFPQDFDTKKMVEDFARIVESASDIIGEIPYKHYTFLIMGEGRGGLEHKNSMAVFSNRSVYNSKEDIGYKHWLGFIAHEYFHLYNIKTIRPINLGPFDYSKENYTNMLWFSEGGTVYYEYLIINRAGFLSSREFLNEVEGGIKNYETIPGHLFQSATQASYDTWINFFNRSENAQNITISYYDKGFALCLLLDLKIRYKTKNLKSLDDVMRTLYNKYYKELDRGFSDKEFRDVCETIAGCSLQEVFTYASTVDRINYPKYFEYAGLSIDTTARVVPSSWLGARFDETNGEVYISSIVRGSPADHVGLSAQDKVLAIDGRKVEVTEIKDLIANKKPQGNVIFTIENRSGRKEIAVKLGDKVERSFEIKPIDILSPMQKEIYQSWLK